MAVVVPPATFIVQRTVSADFDVVIFVFGCKPHISKISKAFREKLRRSEKAMLLAAYHSQ